MREDFAIFILSNGRADNMKTVNTLKQSGYTGKWYIILDDLDTTINRYIELFGKEHIIVFNKNEAVKRTDRMDNIDKYNSIVFARNMCFDIAKQLNLKYFWELEDDYRDFQYRYTEGKAFRCVQIENLDKIINEFLDYLENTSILTIAFAQGGDFIGGVLSHLYKLKVKRKAMNSFFCKVDRPFDFYGRMNDDVNSYTYLGSLGNVFLTVRDVNICQIPTQENKGGNTDMYKEFGTYVKSFYSVMICPSSVKVAAMITDYSRIHHLINWEVAVPKIISSRYKKKEEEK